MQLFDRRFLGVIAALSLITGVLWFVQDRLQPRVVYKAPALEETPTETAPAPGTGVAHSVSGEVATIQFKPLPARVFIEVPFASQAPLGDWGMPYQEACEEASLILVHHFLEQMPLTREVMDAEIKRMVAYEMEELGSDADIGAEETAVVAEKFYGYRATVTYDPGIDDIRRELAFGNPVIVPLAGRDIGNPYYSGEGPWYHMLVIIGYDTKYFITNDVGTRRGASYKYRQQVLYDAIHDWTGVKEDILNGRKAMIVLTK